MPLKILSKDVDAFGSDTYRDDNTAIPLAYRPTIVETINPNKEGTNNMVTVEVKVPVVETINGVTTSKNTFRCTVKYTALQSVTSDAERARALDLAIEYLTARKATLVQGILAASPVTLAK